MKYETAQILEVMPAGEPITAIEIQKHFPELSVQTIGQLIRSELDGQYVDVERSHGNGSLVNIYTKRDI